MYFAICGVQTADLPMEPVGLLPMMEASADGQICAAQMAARTGIEDSAQASEQSVEQIDLKAAG